MSSPNNTVNLGTLDEPKETKELQVYFSKMRSHDHIVRGARKIIVNGDTVKQRSLVARFRNGKFVTKDAEMAKLLDKTCADPRMSRYIFKQPTEEEMSRTKKVQDEISRATKKIIAELGPREARPPIEPEKVSGKPSAFDEFMKQRKEQEKSRKPVRGSIGIYSGGKVGERRVMGEK